MKGSANMLITERKFGIFTFVNVYFAEEPGTADIPECDAVLCSALILNSEKYLPVRYLPALE